jgi:hypothetical protein
MNSANNKSFQEIDINNNLQNTLKNYYKKCGEFLEIPTMNISFKIKTLGSTSPKKSIFGFMKQPSTPILQFGYKNNIEEKEYVNVYNFQSNINHTQLDKFFQGLTFISNKNPVPNETDYQTENRTTVLPHTRPFFILLNQEKINNKNEIEIIINNFKVYVCYLLVKLREMIENKFDMYDQKQFNTFQMYKCALLVIFITEHIMKRIINQESNSILSKLISDVEKLNEYQIYKKIHSMICGNDNQQSGGKGKTKKSKRRSSKSNKKHKKTLRK